MAKPDDDTTHPEAVRKPDPRHRGAQVAAMEQDLGRYRRSGNPVYLWSALRWATLAEVPLPPECADYLAWVAAGLLTLADGRDPDPGRPIRRERIAAKLAEALGMGGRGRNAVAAFRRDRAAERESLLMNARKVLPDLLASPDAGLSESAKRSAHRRRARARRLG